MTKDVVIAPDAKLKDVLIDRLTQLGHPEPGRVLADLYEDKHSENNQSLQQFFINRQLRRYIGKFDSDTRGARTLLDDESNPSVWWYYMEKGVIPCIMAHDCPKPVEAATA